MKAASRKTKHIPTKAAMRKSRAQEFKSLIKELVAIAPEVVKNNAQDVFMSQSYLFSVVEDAD